MGKNIHQVWIDVTTNTGSTIGFLSVDEYLLDSINSMEVDESTEQFEGLFDFYFPEYTFSLIGNWYDGVNVGGTVVKIDEKFRKCRIVREGREFIGFVSPDSIKVRELCPGMTTTEITVLSFASGLKLAPLGKISDYEDVEHPDRTFSLYRKTVNQVPFDVIVPDGGDPKDYTTDVDIYVRPDVFHTEGALITGDKTEFSKVRIFDTETLEADISGEFLRRGNSYRFYKEIPLGYDGNNVHEGYYSYGLKTMPILPINSILQSALHCVDKYFDLVGADWPRFVVKDETIPPQVFIRSIPVISGVWHSRVILHNNKVYAIIWRNQFSVEVFRIDNTVQITSLGEYTYSQWTDRESVESLKGNWLVTNGRGRVWSFYQPSSEWSSIQDGRIQNPRRFNNYHPDGDMFASVFGISNNKIYFGWWMNRHQLAEYNDDSYRMESSVFMHVVSVDTNTGVIRAEGGPTIQNPQNQHFYDDRLLTRWSIPVTLPSGGFYLPRPEHGGIAMHYPRLSGENTFLMATTNWESYFSELARDKEWCKFILRYDPQAPEYERSSHSLLYTGVVGSNDIGLYLEDKTASDLILLVCKLTNSIPIITSGTSQVELSFKQRRLRSEVVDNPKEYDYSILESSLLKYEFRTQTFQLTERDIIIDLDLDNTPDAVRSAFSDYYEEEFIPEGFKIHLATVPMYGGDKPNWVDTIQHGERVLLRGKSLEYIGQKRQYMTTTIVLEER